MFRRSLLNVIIPAALLLCAVPAWAENRMALVIGQSAYKSVPALTNPGNDAKAVTKFLSSAGFQVVQQLDLSQTEMRQAISNFAKSLGVLVRPPEATTGRRVSARISAVRSQVGRRPWNAAAT